MTGPGRTTDHWRVGENFQPFGEDRVGRCESVTLWGQGRVRWVRLRFPDGSVKSYAPSHLYGVPRP